MRQFLHFVKGIDPVADAFNGDPATDIISMRNHNHITFLIHKGVSTGGTDDAVVTVEACDDVSASNSEAIAFNYRAITSGDTHGAYTAATTTGFVMTSGSSQLYAVEVDAEALADSGYEYIRCQITEDTDDPVVASVVAILSEPRYNEAVQPTAIV